MKILMLGWELPPHNSGGLGVACLQMSKALAASGADIDFVVPFATGNEHDFMNVVSSHESAVKQAPDVFAEAAKEAYSSHLYGSGRQKAFGALTKVLDDYEKLVSALVEAKEFDIIHAHDWLTFRAALLAKEQTGKPLIVHIHSTERDRSGGGDGNPLVREIENMAVLMADHVVAVSARIKQIIKQDYGIPSNKIEVVHNSIDSNYLESLDPENAYAYLTALKNNGWKIVANIGRLTIQKGLPHFLRAAAEVIKHSPKTIFLIVGSGEQKEELIVQAAEMGIADKVVFTGFQRGKRWRDAYAVADLFAMPSVSEPFGLTPLEATAYGTPSLISKQSGVSEVFSNCLKVDFWDEREMANQMAGVVNNPVLAEEMQANAAREQENMSWEKAARQLHSLYNAYARGASL